MISQKVQGSVKWFNNHKGYGFIAYDGKDVFIHHKNILGTGYRTLTEGDKVEFELHRGERGLYAMDVTKI